MMRRYADLQVMS